MLELSGCTVQLIGAPVAPDNASGTVTKTGSTYVVYGKASGFTDVELFSPIDAADGKQLFGLNAADHMGFSVSAAGDVNADGFHDVIIGAPYANGSNESGTLFGTGQAYLLFGSPNPPADLDQPDGANGVLLQGAFAYDRAGWSVATAGDVNGDGFDDFLVGTPVDDDFSLTAKSGKAYLVYGSGAAFAPTLNLGQLPASSGVEFGPRP